MSARRSTRLSRKVAPAPAEGSVVQETRRSGAVALARQRTISNAATSARRRSVVVAEKYAGNMKKWRKGEPERMTDVATVVAAAQLQAKLKSLRWRRPWVVKIRWTLAWLFNYLLMGLNLFYSLIIAIKFGDGPTSLMIGSWVLAYGCTFAIIEPVQVIFLAATPWLFTDDTRCGRCMIRARFIYNELLAP